MNLAELPLGSLAEVTRVGGSGSFRRRLMELGILPGTRVEVVSSAPLGDPLELLVRGASLSIRREQAVSVEVAKMQIEATSEPSNSAVSLEREGWLSKLRRFSPSK
jgi:Fe2+ transport system protein FeoA